MLKVRHEILVSLTYLRTVNTIIIIAENLSLVKRATLAKVHFVRQVDLILCKTYIALAALLVDVGLVGVVGVVIGAMSPPPIAG